MAITQTLSVYDFQNAFMKSDTYKNNFSYDGLEALFEYLENLSDGMQQPIEFDMVAIACEYSEYETAIEACDEYTNEDDRPYTLDDNELDGLDPDEVATLQEEKAIEYLQYHTTVIDFDTGIIIQDY